MKTKMVIIGNNYNIGEEFDGTSFEVDIFVENPEVAKYGRILESGHHDGSQWLPSGETYKFIEPALDDNEEFIEGVITKELVTVESFSKVVDEVSVVIRESVVDEIMNKPNFYRPRKNPTLKETYKLVNGIKTESNILKEPKVKNKKNKISTRG